MNGTQSHLQHEYHDRLFAALHDWDAARATIADLTGRDTADGMLGLDQLGHFGSHGCDRVLAVVDERCPRWPAAICELGSGYGGVLRYLLPRLRRRGREVRAALGVELVLEHCRLFARIDRSFGERAASVVCGTVTALPVASGGLDVVFATGSFPHFADVPGVLREAHRALRPGGLLTFTEEVSLTHPGARVSERFRAEHPEGVFFLCDRDTRLRQLGEAGFEQVTIEDLTAWARDLVGDRVRAVRLLRGTTERVFGGAGAERVLATLESALEEYVAGRLCPALVIAVRPQ